MARPQVRHALLPPLLTAVLSVILVRLVRGPRLQQAAPVTIGT
ncbi:hypothetical protein [Streptomyces olivaceoviridis]|nr:hypothetical protein [Streptomyces olivaceoviridis]